MEECGSCGHDHASSKPCTVRSCECATSKKSKAKKLKSFLVSAGDSSKGPVGFCMRVRATTKAQAIKIAKAALPECIEDAHKDFDMDDDIEYFNVYFNDAALTVADIEDGETEDA
jgi:hypothetical protein